MRILLSAVLCLAIQSVALASSAKFLDYRDYLLAGTPEVLAIADVNNDHIPDAIVGTAGGLQVLLGRGDGTFAAPRTITRTAIWAIAVADFNNDGKLDIATTILTNGTQVTVALGNGDGTFQPAQVIGGCIDCYLAAGDFNGDGKMDLALAQTSEITFLLGHGDGTFGAGVFTYPAQFVTAITAGNLNGDGKPDLVVTDFGAQTAIVLLGNGDGSFQRRDYSVGTTSFQAVLADFNGDGLLDIAVADRNSDTALVLLNQGDGVFGPYAAYPAGCSPFQSCTFEGIAAGDFNHDGKMDLATPGAILLGNGDGTFQAAQHFHSGAFPWQVASADLNHDDFSDLLVANSAGLNMSVLLGTPVSISRPLGFAPGNDPKDVVAADWNGDGEVDLAVAAAGDNAVNIFLGEDNGRFTKGASLPAQQPGALIAADLNKDGKTDLAISSLNGTWIYLGNGDGTFRAGAQYPSFYGDCTFNAVQQTASPCFATADFNHDGIPDLVGAVWISGTVTFLLGNGDGTYRPGPQTLTVSDVPAGLAVGDFNHDGNIDVAVSGYYGSVTIFPGRGDGTFGAGVIVATGSTTGAGLAAADVDGDGNLDIVLAGGAGGSVVSLAVFVIPGNGDLTFRAPIALGADESPNDVVIADFNGDGRLDIASVNVLGDSVTVLVNQGNLTFAPEALYGAGSGPVVIRSANLNKDGLTDLVVVNQNSSDINVLLHAPR